MNKKYSSWSRRDFLNAMGTACAAIAVNPLSGWAIEDVDSRVAAIVAATMGIDAHNHVDVPLFTAELPGPDIDIAGEMKKSGLSAISMTFALDYQRLDQPGQAYERFLNGLTMMDQQLAKNKMQRALNLADLQKAKNAGSPIVIQSIEGGHFLEGQLERMEVAYERGMRHLCLLHDSDASVPLGDVYTNPVKYGGLTAFGKNVIKECNRLGMLVDLAHGAPETVAAALKIADKPILISHTGLDTKPGNNEVMAKMMRPRLISKENAKVVADAGGVIGVWTYLTETPLEYAQNIRSLVDVIGVDHVCLGTDTKLTPAYHTPGTFVPKPKPGQPHGGDPTNRAWAGQKVGFYYAVVGAMLKTGFTADEIAKIGGGNYCRVFNAATAGH